MLDQAIDGAYAALSSYVDALARLPDGGPMTEAARLVDSALFPLTSWDVGTGKRGDGAEEPEQAPPVAPEATGTSAAAPAPV